MGVTDATGCTTAVTLRPNFPTLFREMQKPPDKPRTSALRWRIWAPYCTCNAKWDSLESQFLCHIHAKSKVVGSLSSYFGGRNRMIDSTFDQN